MRGEPLSEWKSVDFPMRITEFPTKSFVARLISDCTDKRRAGNVTWVCDLLVQWTSAWMSRRSSEIRWFCQKLQWFT